MSIITVGRKGDNTKPYISRWCKTVQPSIAMLKVAWRTMLTTNFVIVLTRTTRRRMSLHWARMRMGGMLAIEPEVR